MENIESDFRVSGIFPFDKSVISNDGFYPWELTKYSDGDQLHLKSFKNATPNELDDEQIDHPTKSRDSFIGIIQN